MANTDGALGAEKAEAQISTVRVITTMDVKRALADIENTVGPSSQAAFALRALLYACGQ